MQQTEDSADYLLCVQERNNRPYHQPFLISEQFRIDLLDYIYAIHFSLNVLSLYGTEKALLPISLPAFSFIV